VAGWHVVQAVSTRSLTLPGGSCLAPWANRVVEKTSAVVNKGVRDMGTSWY
jgi:hypothetical protein